MSFNPNEAVIISTEDSLYFAERLAQLLGVSICPTKRKVFPGGELYFCIGIEDWDVLFGKFVILVGSLTSEKVFAEVKRVGTTCAMMGARRVVYVMPSMFYETMERATIPGQVVTFKTICRELSNLPFGAQSNAFLTMDLHVAGSINYFEGSCFRHELTSDKHWKRVVGALNMQVPVMATADLGRMRMVEMLAKEYLAKMAFISKEREFELTHVLNVFGDVVGCDVFLYDDLTRSSGTAVAGVQTYVQRGARIVYLGLSHVAFNDETAMAKLLNCPAERIFVTNSHPSSQMSAFLSSPRVNVVDVSPDFAHLIQQLA